MDSPHRLLSLVRWESLHMQLRKDDRRQGEQDASAQVAQVLRLAPPVGRLHCRTRAVPGRKLSHSPQGVPLGERKRGDLQHPRTAHHLLESKQGGGQIPVLRQGSRPDLEQDLLLHLVPWDGGLQGAVQQQIGQPQQVSHREVGVADRSKKKRKSIRMEGTQTTTRMRGE